MENEKEILIIFEWRLVDDSIRGSLSTGRFYYNSQDAIRDAIELKKDLTLKGYHFNKIILNKLIYENVSNRVINVLNFKDLSNNLDRKVIC